MARYLITGGAGFIGSNIAHRLIEQGDRVVVFDNFSTGRKANLEEIKKHKNLRVVEGDICDLVELKKEAKKTDFVLHHAALPSVQRSMKKPLDSNEVNVVGTLNVLIAAHTYSSVKRVVFSSSSSAYGDSPTLPKVETMQNNPLSPYAVSKIAGEDYCRMFYSSFRLDTVVLRYFNVFGPRQNPTSQYAAVVPKFIGTLLRGREPLICGDGKQSRDFTYVENVVDANLLATQTPKAGGEILNIACGTRVTILGLANFLAQVLGREVNPRFEKARPGDVRHSLADITKAREFLGFRPKYGIEEGLRMTVDWYQKRRR
jgi:UDP-N-acetylglucosamine/UDP-N-acetyl-alpha-D-glucosaminouronate 4-epimerase